MPHLFYLRCKIVKNTLLYGNAEYDINKELPSANFLRDFLGIFCSRRLNSCDVYINERNVVCSEKNTLVKSDKPVVISNYLSEKLTVTAPKVTIIKAGTLKELNVITDELEMTDSVLSNCFVRLSGKTRILECNKFYSKKMEFDNCDLRNLNIPEFSIENIKIKNCVIGDNKLGELLKCNIQYFRLG
ncbi:MAG: hypothetical protein CMM93_06660 [Rickettsiales bacterium]|nr:hypothetical protein [Rickettsiales bacterium]